MRNHRLHQALKRMLEDQGLNQSEAAFRMGCSVSHFSHLILGNKNLTPKMLVKLKRVLHMSEEQLQAIISMIVDTSEELRIDITRMPAHSRAKLYLHAYDLSEERKLSGE